MKSIQLTEEQSKKNNQILAQLEAERQRLVEETRALQQQFRRKVRRKRKDHSDGNMISAGN
jgi:hypothetical protein